MTRARRSFAALLAAALLVMPAGAASAHDRLLGSDPEDGSTGGPPEEIVLTFSAAVGELGAQMAVTDGEGRSVVDGDPEVDGVEVTQDLVDDLSEGDYEVVWRVTSEDGHPISGALGFTVEGTAGSADDTGDGSDDSTSDASDDGSGDSPEDSTDDAPEDRPEDATGDSSGDSSAEAAAPGPDDADVTAGPASADGSGGLPAWGWAVVALAAVGLLGLLGRTWSRGRE